MTTKIGIDLPPELLEAARITQAANRNRLSIREKQVEIKNRILNEPEVINQKVNEEKERAVNEYINPVVALSKSSKSFSWAIVETIVSDSYEEILSGVLTETLIKEANHVLSTSKNINSITRFFSGLAVVKTPSFSLSGSYLFGEPRPFVVPEPYVVVLSKEEIKEQRTNPQFVQIVAETKSSLNLWIKHSTTSALSSSASGDGADITNINGTAYSAAVSLYVPTSANKKVYLYMTYKSTGKLNSFSNGVYKFFGLPEGGNELVLATETSSDVYSGDSVVWLSYNNFVFRPKINDELISRPNAATSYQSAVTFTRSHTNPFASEYNPNFARIDLPGSSVQSLSAGNLPSALQGLFTVMYELPQIDSVSKVEMLIGGNSGPLSGGVSNPYLSDGESSSEVGSSTLIYNENILFTFSSVNYANP